MISEWVEYKGSGTHYPDPYPNEEPLFVIIKDNYLDYKENLTDGQITLFENYPETYKMPVYESKRDVRYSDLIHENVKVNAVSAEIISDGNRFKNAYYGTPFPFAKTRCELIWNHQASLYYGATRGILDSAAVYDDGEVISRSKRSSINC